MDRQVKAERAWLVPFTISEKLGGFDFTDLCQLSQQDVYRLMTDPEPLHRYPEVMGANFHSAVSLIDRDYGGDAANIWEQKPSSATVVYRFLDFRGVGPKIATMAANILARIFKVPMSDYYSIDLSPDVQVRRVFWRLGLSRKDATVEELVYRGRAMNPDFPGIVDGPAWEVGRKWCRPKDPLCSECFLRDVCPSRA